jgi:hypothetical protein
MTPDEYTAKLPNLTSNPLPIQPPFVFNGMSSRVFPLRAHLGTLQRLCDSYMNFIPPQAGYFRVPMPYVYVMVLDYGQVAEAVARIGWFAQTEVFFMIPVEWYKLIDGKWVFNNWAVITPYVFVNDEFSVPLGRTVYGFPKVLARVVNTSSEWVKNATGPVTLARVETSVFPESYSGTELESRVFLEVERGTISNLRVPFDPASPVLPWSIATHLAQAAAGFSRDATWLAQSMRLSAVNPLSNPGFIPQMMQQMAPWLAPSGSGFVQNSINLKQFRRSNEPDQICYQALTNGCMEVKSFNGAGLLGEYPIMLGDLSGGHTVRIYEYATLPIVRTLGLEVHRSWKGPDCTVAELKPVVPFWLDVDIRYDQGENLAWRVDDMIWRDSIGNPFDPQPPATDSETPAYNQTFTTAIDDIAGPFEFSDSTVRVLPLLAERKQLQSFLDGYINAPFEKPMTGEDGKKERIRFTVWGRPEGPGTQSTAVRDHAHIYLMVSSFGGVTSTTNNVGDWTKYQMSFMIPVQFERANGKGGWDIAGVGLVPAFSFVDNCIAAIARLEVQGFEATVANFYKPESVWLSDEVDFGENPPQTLLRVDTEVWPAIGEGQKAVIMPAVEICQGLPDAGLGDAPNAAWRWAALQSAELDAKKHVKADQSTDLKIVRALVLELLGNRMPITAYSLKQFRDARDPKKACYQSLVRVPRLIKELNDLREIEETLVVRIHNYPSLDIVGKLGLVTTDLPTSGSGIISCAQAIRPFFLRGTLYEPLAERLTYRGGNMDWFVDREAMFSTLLSDEKGAPPITVDFRAETLQDQMDPCRIDAIMAQARQRVLDEAELGKAAGASKAVEKNSDRFSKADARRAVGKIDPQTVIECILSREWGNADENAKWRAGRRELIQAFSALPITGETSAFAESVLYRRVNNSLTLAPGSVAAPVQVKGTYRENLNDAIEKAMREKPTTPDGRWQQTIDTIIFSQEKFTRWRLSMEKSLGIVASAAVFYPLGIKDVYSQLGESAPTDAELMKICWDLILGLDEVGHFQIVGEPSEHNNLDYRVSADQRRLNELLRQVADELTKELLIVLNLNKLAEKKTEEKEDLSPELLRWVFDHTAQFQRLVDLARGFCNAQTQAFLNKLSRAFQKPDFCIRRDSVGDDCNQFLPLSLSWNEDWYYGKEVGPTPARPQDPSNDLQAAVKRNRVVKSGGKRVKV